MEPVALVRAQPLRRHSARVETVQETLMTADQIFLQKMVAVIATQVQLLQPVLPGSSNGVFQVALFYITRHAVFIQHVTQESQLIATG